MPAPSLAKIVAAILSEHTREGGGPESLRKICERVALELGDYGYAWTLFCACYGKLS